jgi:hypothetical protein
MNSIGTHYLDAESNTVTTVEYYGEEITVYQNVFEDSVQVTQEMPEVSGISDSETLRAAFNEVLTGMAILESLDYELSNCDDGVAFWSKPISE